MERSLSSQSL